MRYIALLALIGAGLLALPSSASAQTSTCPFIVHVSAGPDGYACLDVSGAGGEIVINRGPKSCSYINGWATNPGTPGYAGICTNATHDPNCNGSSHDPPGPPNEGGCFWIKDAPEASALLNDISPVRGVTDMFMCGNTSGENPATSSRDGCFIP